MQKNKQNRMFGCIKKTFLKTHVNKYSKDFTDQFIEKIKNISKNENYIMHIQSLLNLLTANTIQNSILGIKLINKTPQKGEGKGDSESQRTFNFSQEREYHGNDNIDQFKNNDNIGLKIPLEQIKMLEDLSGQAIGFDQYIEIKLKNRKFCTKISKNFYTKYGKIIPRE